MALQQRIYQLPLEPDAQDAWVAWWRGLAGPRAVYGFTIVSAVLDRETGVFTWTVRHDGDFAAAEQAYLASPERGEVFAQPKPASSIIRVALVDEIV